MQVLVGEELGLASLWAWTACASHLVRPAPTQWLAEGDHRQTVEEVIKALHRHPQIIKFSAKQATLDNPHSRPPTPEELDRFVTGLVVKQMAAEEVQGGVSPGLIQRNRSWSKGREVSWDEMGSLGLHKALNEYYKMTTPKGTPCPPRLRGRGRGSQSLLATLLCATVLRPLPWLLTPEALYAAASWAAHLGALVVYQTAVFTIPLALWLVAASASSSGNGATIQLPATLVQAFPALASLRPFKLPPLPVALAGLLAFLFLLRVAERVVRSAAANKAARAARALQPELLEQYYAGWQMPESHPAEQQQQGHHGTAAGSTGDGSDEEGKVMQRLARETALVCDKVYGEGSGPKDLESYDDLAAFVLRLCNDAGVEVEAASQRSPDVLVQLLQEAKQAIGIP